MKICKKYFLGFFQNRKIKKSSSFVLAGENVLRFWHNNYNLTDRLFSLVNSYTVFYFNKKSEFYFIILENIFLILRRNSCYFNRVNIENNRPSSYRWNDTVIALKNLCFENCSIFFIIIIILNNLSNFF